MREVCSLLYLWLLKVEWSNMKISLLEEEQEIPIRFNRIEKIPAEQREQFIQILKEAIEGKTKEK